MSDGSSVHTGRWCEYFQSQGYDTALFSLEPITVSSRLKTYQGKRITGRGLIDYSLARHHFQRVVADFKPDCINAHFAASYGWLASHVDDCPVIVTAWGSDVLLLPKKSIMQRNRVKRALSCAAACTVDGKNLADAVEKYMPAEKIHRVVMGVDEQLLSLVQERKRPGEDVRIMAPRGLQPVYDPDTIIDAIHILPQSMRINVTLRGDGEWASKYERIIGKKSWSDRIRIQPRLSHGKYLQLLASHDVYVSASLSDSTSVSLLEAMALGLYPVISDIEGNREWITDGQNGILFEPKNPHALASALKQAVALKETYSAVADFNRCLVERDGVWQKNMARVDTIIKDVVR